MMVWGAPKQAWRKGPWTHEEDKLLAEYVTFHGEGRWSSVARSTGLNRSGKSCRLRWVNYLRPGLKRGHITPQEEGIIVELHALWGKVSSKATKRKALKLKQQPPQTNKEETAAVRDGGGATGHEGGMCEEAATLLDDYLMNEGLWWNQQQQANNIAMQMQQVACNCYGGDVISNEYNGVGYIF
ncbi:hypothetical protein CXB51_016334 [Gossypium anomalum]|uniref:Uncharacterized protein n=1 Tax=Gossypium anomalum TaxID=47600 RepID=A0A8J6CUW3_9ROSI|nr:hypothetical protein CXB51_016334 [Gossypium anomalum]